jgi:hypothetical protein
LEGLKGRPNWGCLSPQNRLPIKELFPFLPFLSPLIPTLTPPPKEKKNEGIKDIRLLSFINQYPQNSDQALTLPPAVPSG